MRKTGYSIRWFDELSAVKLALVLELINFELENSLCVFELNISAVRKKGNSERISLSGQKRPLN